MNGLRCPLAAFLGSAFVGVLWLAVPSVAEAAVRNCSELERDLTQIAGNESLRPRLAPGRSELAEARAAVDAAQAALDASEANRAQQQAARDAALNKLGGADAAAIQTAQESLSDAAARRDQANAALKTAKATLHCQEHAYTAERNFRHSAGVGLLAARAADDTARWAFALRYQQAVSSSRAWEASFEVGRFWLSVDDPRRDTLLDASYRWKFGTGTTALVLGGGIGWLPSKFKRPWRGREYAALGDLGVEFRIKNSCPSLSKSCYTFWPDIRASVQPWLPFDGSSVAILFGIQLGASVGFGRLGP